MVYRLELSRFSVCSINACVLPFYFIFCFFLLIITRVHGGSPDAFGGKPSRKRINEQRFVCAAKFKSNFVAAAHKGGGTNGPVDQVDVSGADYTRPCILFWARALFARGKRK